MKILKFTIQDHGTEKVAMPHGARIIHVAEQGQALQLWAVCLPSAPLEYRLVHVVFTGHDYVDWNWHHVGTVLSSGGNIVRHVFVE